MASPPDDRKPPLTLRPGRAADWEAVWRWRRDPLTRAMSRRTQELSPEVVRAEVEAAVDAEDKRLLIAEQEGAPCGVVRFDRRPDGRWEASLNLAPEARGQGLGRPMLEQAIARAFPARPPALTAQIKPQNAASRRLFEDLGFVETGEQGGLVLYERPEGGR